MTETPAAPTDSEVLASVGELRTVIGKLRRRLQQHIAPGGFTPSQISVMTRLLTDGPTTLTALARAEAMRPQSMSAIVAALESANYVHGTPDPSDRRQTILAATNEARDAASAVQAAKDDWLLDAIRDRLTEPEQADFVRSIPLLARLVEPQPETRSK